MKFTKSFFLLLLFWFVSTLIADTIVLQNGLEGYDGCNDSYIYVNRSSSNYGSLDSLSAKYDMIYYGGGFTIYRKRVVIRFDLSSIPEHTEITNATLSLYAYSDDYPEQNRLRDCSNKKNDKGNDTKELYKLTSCWIDTLVTWRSPWEKNGGDFVEFALIDSNDNSEVQVWENFDVTSTVKSHALCPAENFGFIIKFRRRSRCNVNYYSSEHSDQEKRPKLAVTFKQDVEAPDVKVSSPAEGQVLKQGDFCEIEWNAIDNVIVASRAIHFSPDGSTWSLIDSTAGNTGAFRWKVPLIASTNCRIRVTAFDPAGNAGHNISGIFTIEKPAGINPERFSTIFPRNYKVIVINASGRTVASFKNEKEIAGGLPNGVYYIKTFTKNSSFVKKTAVMK